MSNTIINQPTTIGSAPPTRVTVGTGIRVGGGDPFKLGFTPIPVGNRKESLFLIVVGKQSSGKNSLAYSAVEEGKPVLEIDIIERGTGGDEYMQQFLSTGKILRKSFVANEKDPLNAMEAKRIWDEFTKILLGLYGFDGTIIINTIDEIYEIARMAVLGKLENVLRRDYGPVNREMNQILGYFARTECPTNLILISKGVDVWVNGEATNAMEYKGFPNAKYMSDAIVAVHKQVLVDPAAADKKAKGQILLPVEKRFSATITRAPAATKEEGSILMGNELRFVEVKRRVLPVVKS